MSSRSTTANTRPARSPRTTASGARVGRPPKSEEEKAASAAARKAKQAAHMATQRASRASEAMTAPKLTKDQFARLLASSEGFYKRDGQHIAEDVKRGEVGGRRYIVKDQGSPGLGRADPGQDKAVWDIAKAAGLQQYFVPTQTVAHNGRSYLVQPEVAGQTVKDAGGGSRAARQALSTDDRQKLSLLNYLLGDGDRSEYNTILTPGGGVRQIDMQGALSTGGHRLTPDEYGVLSRDGINHGVNYQPNTFDAAAKSVQSEKLSPAVQTWLRDSVLNNPAVSRAATRFIGGQHEGGSTPRYWHDDNARSVFQAAFENRTGILREFSGVKNPSFGDLSRIAHEERWNDIGQQRAEALHARYSRTTTSRTRTNAPTATARRKKTRPPK